MPPSKKTTSATGRTSDPKRNKAAEERQRLMELQQRYPTGKFIPRGPRPPFGLSREPMEFAVGEVRAAAAAGKSLYGRHLLADVMVAFEPLPKDQADWFVGWINWLTKFWEFYDPQFAPGCDILAAIAATAEPVTTTQPRHDAANAAASSCADTQTIAAPIPETPAFNPSSSPVPPVDASLEQNMAGNTLTLSTGFAPADVSNPPSNQPLNTTLSSGPKKPVKPTFLWKREGEEDANTFFRSIYQNDPLDEVVENGWVLFDNKSAMSAVRARGQTESNYLTKALQDLGII